ncbi:DUF4397 domain-containing protein [Mucilaginibacter rigui]|uniref:DUF4397 domain-containing protein n=1 Tax=Mucilaginibacter rigui TaxID=534635 RepID=A0ABR7XDH9_9SPHI|nr:DUF4397 domain-containing protein [Mucilaginibacter rigui]MBD1387690.1 DUF4397 domain-containing protein [Mucilaginibacter rigui]
MMKFKLSVFIGFIGVIVIASCKKGNDAAPATPLKTSINFVNASADTINFYVNGSRLNTTAASYPLASTGYLTTPLGEQNYEVKKDRNPNILFNLVLPVDTGKVYSFFVTDNTSANTFTVVDTLQSVDTLTMIRFVHTSPRMGEVKILMNDTVAFANAKFKSVSDYLHVTPGLKQIKVVDVATGNVLINEPRVLQLNRAYTLFTKGALMATDAPAISGTGLIINR